MRARARSEEGWAIVIAVAVMGVMLGLGLGVMAFVGGQQKAAGDERVSESSYNLAEAALNSAAAYLSVAGKFPTAGSPYGTCTQSSASNCPTPASLTNQFTTADYGGAPTWETTVRDNGAPTPDFYREADTGTQPAYDANGDGSVWVRSEAEAKGQRRVVVALVRSTSQPENFPRNVITAGKLETTNNGKKVLIDTQGSSLSASKISLRCTTSSAPGGSNPCLKFEAGKGQVSPPTWETGSTGATCPDGSAKCAMDDAGLERMRQTAISAGKWYSSCAGRTPAELTGPIVFVENGPCSIGSNSVINSNASPGVLIVANGTISVGGNATFYGVLYAANRTQLTGYVISTSGNSLIKGAAVVDFDGGVSVGSSKLNIVYDSRAFDQIKSSGSVSMISGTFREVPSR